MPLLRPSFGLSGASALATLLTAGIYAVMDQQPQFSSLPGGAFASLWLVLFLASKSGELGFQEALVAQFQQRPPRLLLVPAALSCAYGLYAVATEPAWPAAALAIGFLWLPAILSLSLPRHVLAWDLLILVSIWFPIDFGLIKSSWDWPAGQGAIVYGHLSAAVVCFFCFAGPRYLAGIGHSWRLTIADAKIMGHYLTLATLMVVPFGLASGFLGWQPERFSVLGFCGVFLGSLLVAALPEELLFRGIITNLIQKYGPAKPQVSLVLGAAIFGLAHLNNEAVPGAGSGDWRFVLFAAICGYFYGMIWHKTRRLLPGAIVHAWLNAVWFQLLWPQA